MDWSFYQIWNESLEEGRTQKPPQPRNRIWASEMGGSMVDRFLKMTCVAPSNPPNPRSLRKFEAGNIWETIVGYVLRRSGILQQHQEWLSYQYPGFLEVTGKLDFEAGGKPDYDKAQSILRKEFDWLPEFISRATERIVLKLSAQFPNGLKNIILEIKSCSSFMFERYEKIGDASPQHKLQTFHYLKAKSKDEGHIVYVCKDDARLLEIGVFNPSSTEDEYKKDIETITKYILAKERPPLEPPIVFEPCKFSSNWKVGYSSYLKMLYGLENQFAFDEKYKPIAERWNRVLERISGGKSMTDNNKEALDEITRAGFDVDTITAVCKKEETNGNVGR